MKGKLQIYKNGTTFFSYGNASLRPISGEKPLEEVDLTNEPESELLALPGKLRDKKVIDRLRKKA